MMRERISSRRIRRSLRVVVLDEHPGSRRMMCFVLGNSGHEVIPVATQAEALDALARFRADAIIYDWDTRGGPLLGLGHRLREQAVTIRAVVVVSARDEPTGFCLDEAIDGYFTKPCAMREVVSHLERLVVTPSR
jgi:DNA-binding response OmpR family regulator